MKAHKKRIFTFKGCHGTSCTKRAKWQIFTGFGAHFGDYCLEHADQRLRKFWADEKRMEEL